jgi:hypothetical protein
VGPLFDAQDDVLEPAAGIRRAERDPRFEPIAPFVEATSLAKELGSVTNACGAQAGQEPEGATQSALIWLANGVASVSFVGSHCSFHVSQGLRPGARLQLRSLVSYDAETLLTRDRSDPAGGPFVNTATPNLAA